MASISPKRSSVENFLLLWLDENINETSEEYRTSISLFQSFINTIHLFSNPDKFRKFIREIIDEKIFLIISGSFGEQLVPEMEIQPQIYSMYIYCNQREYHEQWTKDYLKVKGVYTDLQSICNAFRRDIRQATNDLTLISTTNSNELDQSLLFKEILMNIQSNDQMKNQLIEYSRLYYRENAEELNVIDQYEKSDYNQISPITWYTRECFISSMINRALRLYDIEILNKMTFFIQDLNKQIKDLHTKSMDYQQLTVYYGQGISNDQLIKFQINGLISFNSFLLTTIDKDLSLNFAKQSGNNSNLMPVLFQIEIDRSMTSFAFVSLDKLDYYHDTDQHILFSLNSIFRIIHIERLEEKLWQMNLILIDDNDKQLKDLTNSIQKKSGKSKGFLSLGEMLFKMNDLHKAKNILQILLQNTNDLHQKDLFSIHCMLGRIYQKTNDFATTLFHYNECLKAQLSYLSPNDPLLSATFAGIGAISEKLGHLDQALEYFKRAAADNNHHGSKIDPSIVAIFYISLGRILLKQGENLEARKNFELALNFAQKSHVHNENFLAEIHRYLTIVS